MLIMSNLHFRYKMKLKILIFIYILSDFISFGSCVPLDEAKKIDNLVKDFGYPFIKHNVQTEDGYILEIHNIPAGRNESTTGSRKNKPVALLMHGSLGSSVDWVATGPNVSLAFLLADQGYDVWLGNNRGNTFCRNHIKYLESSYGFWNFSFHEIGMYDLPATIDYILKATGERKLFYVGYSQGTMVYFVMGSLRPEYNDKIRLAVQMAPIAYLGHARGIIRLTAELFTTPMHAFFDKFGHVEMMSASSLTRLATKILCEDIKITQPLCYTVLALYTGVDRLPGMKNEERKILLTKMFPYVPAGTSTKKFVHFGYGFTHPHTFRQYDYGPIENMKIYKSTTPPDYPLENITAPMAVYYGNGDILSDPQDVKLLLEKLKSVVHVSFSNVTLSHLAFEYGSNIREDVYVDVLKVMKKF